MASGTRAEAGGKRPNSGRKRVHPAIVNFVLLAVPRHFTDTAYERFKRAAIKSVAIEDLGRRQALSETEDEEDEIWRQQDVVDVWKSPLKSNEGVLKALSKNNSVVEAIHIDGTSIPPPTRGDMSKAYAEVAKQSRCFPEVVVCNRGKPLSQSQVKRVWLQNKSWISPNEDDLAHLLEHIEI